MESTRNERGQIKPCSRTNETFWVTRCPNYVQASTGTNLAALGDIDEARPNMQGVAVWIPIAAMKLASISETIAGRTIQPSSNLSRKCKISVVSIDLATLEVRFRIGGQVWAQISQEEFSGGKSI